MLACCRRLVRHVWATRGMAPHAISLSFERHPMQPNFQTYLYGTLSFTPMTMLRHIQAMQSVQFFNKSHSPKWAAFWLPTLAAPLQSKCDETGITHRQPNDKIRPDRSRSVWNNKATWHVTCNYFYYLITRAKLFPKNLSHAQKATDYRANMVWVWILMKAQHNTWFYKNNWRVIFIGQRGTDSKGWAKSELSLNISNFNQTFKIFNATDEK